MQRLLSCCLKNSNCEDKEEKVVDLEILSTTPRGLEDKRGVLPDELKGICGATTFNYITIDRLGDGSSSVVDKCYDIVGQRYVAIKREFDPVRNHLRISHSSRESRRQFNREIKVLRILEQGIDKEAYGSIPKLYDLFMKSNVMNIVIQYIDGLTLYEYVNSRKLLPLNLVRKLFRKICTVMKHVHSLKIIHRDLKPENIMLTLTSLDNDNVPEDIVIIDWGLSEFLEPDMSDAPASGSHFYVAPEVVMPGLSSKCLHVSEKNDIWSLGVILYFMVARSIPYRLGREREIIRQVRTLSINYNVATLPEGVIPLLKKIFTSYKNRATIDEILNDPWLLSDVEERFYNGSNMMKKKK